MMLMLLWACHVDLDFMIHNGRHCSIVDEALCTEGDEWDRICTSCEESYPWDADYNWMASTLSGGESIRAISPDTVVPIAIDTDDMQGVLDAYFIPSHGERADLSEVTVLYNHGNYAGIEHYLPRLQMLHEWGVNLLVWDYRGYGKSMPKDHPTPDQFLADARQIYRDLYSYAVDPSKIIVYANSLGGIPAVEMVTTTENAPCALFMEAAWTSMRQNALAFSTSNLPGGFLSQGKFENDIKIKDYNGPVFFMHGTIDIKFPIEHVQEVYDNAPGPKDLWILEGINHGIANGGVPEASLSDYFNHMDDFISAHASSCL